MCRAPRGRSLRRRHSRKPAGQTAGFLHSEGTKGGPSMLQSLNHVNFFNANQIPSVSGYSMALTKASAAARAFTAGKLVLGWVYLVEPRVTQAARLNRVSVPSVYAALDI